MQSLLTSLIEEAFGPDAPRLFALRRIWLGRWRQRLDLAELENHQLADIGRTRQEAERESSKPFWLP